MFNILYLYSFEIEFSISVEKENLAKNIILTKHNNSKSKSST